MDVALSLPDGRQMMVADVGDPHGIPVLYVAGYGHCRLARHPYDALAAEAGVRLLAIDPPGLGGSDPRPGYSLRAWARDGIELAGHLGIGRFAVAIPPQPSRTAQPWRQPHEPNYQTLTYVSGSTGRPPPTGRSPSSPGGSARRRRPGGISGDPGRRRPGTTVLCRP